MSVQDATKTMPATLNGLDTTAMMDTVNALKNDPSLAQFEFRATNEWQSGGENHSRIKDFYGAGMEDDSRTVAFEYVNDEPPMLLGNNAGANPVEYLLHALAGCVTTTTVLHATARGINIQRLSTKLTGTMDLQGLLALDDAAPVGYKSIDIEMKIEADATDEELEELLAFAKNHSPVCNTVCQPVPVNLMRVS